MQVTWTDNEQHVTLEIGAATVGSALIERVVTEHLRTKVTTLVSLATISQFAKLIKYTHHASGLKAPLPQWNSTAEAVDEAFAAFLAMPEGLGDAWYAAVEGLAEAATPPTDSPLANTATPISPVSTRRGKQRRKLPVPITG